MPDDRFIHPRMRFSQKVSTLSDLEFRIWIDYMLAADDFGVMPDNPAKLRGGNTALAARPESDLRTGLDNIVQTGLLLRFEHQGQPFLCDPKWSDFQKVMFPRRTYWPAPTLDEIFNKMSPKTAAFFKKKHPQWSDTSNLDPESTSVESFHSNGGRVGHRLKANGKRLTAKANGKRPTARRARALKEPRPHFVKELLTAYETAFLGRYQRKPIITGRDAKVAKEVLDGIDIDHAKALPQAIALVQAFIASNDPFLLGTAHHFAALPSQANRLLVGAPKAQDRANLSDKWAGVAPGRVKL